MRTKDFVAALEAGFQRSYDSSACTRSVPYTDKVTGEMLECIGVLLSKREHLAVVTAHAAHWIAEDPDARFDHGDDPSEIMDLIEDFANQMSGVQMAPYMQWTCAYFPGLTAEQMDVDDNIDPVDGSFTPN